MKGGQEPSAWENYRRTNQVKVLRMLAISLAVLLVWSGVALSQTWTPLKNQPSFAPNDALLLTDGRVIVQDTNASDWWTLTPDSSGDYIKGTWKQIASLQSGYAPLYHAAAILPDGRLVIQGGEYNGTGSPVWTNLGAVYDPLKNKWTPLAAPPGWRHSEQRYIHDWGSFRHAGRAIERQDVEVHSPGWQRKG
jgi:hypothetical protein